MREGGQRHAPAALPPGKTRYQSYRKLGGPQGRSGRMRNISPPKGFDPRTVQPVARRYTGCAIAARNKNDTDNNGGKKYESVMHDTRWGVAIFSTLLLDDLAVQFTRS